MVNATLCRRLFPPVGLCLAFLGGDTLAAHRH